MRILNSIHLYPPSHTCGAEFMAHWINKDLIKAGHEVKVLLHQANQYNIKKVYDFDGVAVFPPDQNIIQSLFMWADAIITHLDYTDWTINMASVMQKPVFHLIHNTYKNEKIALSQNPQFIVYNSEWAKSELAYNHDSFVMPPACDYRHYDTNKDPSTNEYITLINIDQNKGGEILRDIANAMPTRKFLAVKGSYSEPSFVGQITDQPSNVTIVEKTTDIKSIYAKTRVLIMPSRYESWGRTATEAMCSGIPVISSGTPGLRENCGDAGIYVDRGNIKKWVEEITKLDTPARYRKASDKAKERSRELDPVKGLTAFRRFMQESIMNYKYKKAAQYAR